MSHLGPRRTDPMCPDLIKLVEAISFLACWAVSVSTCTLLRLNSRMQMKLIFIGKKETRHATEICGKVKDKRKPVRYLLNRLIVLNLVQTIFIRRKNTYVNTTQMAQDLTVSATLIYKSSPETNQKLQYT